MAGRWFVAVALIGAGATACAQVAGLGEYGEAADPPPGVGGGGGGAGGDEDCTNAVDDDQDGATDCADDDCADHGCLPSVPPGFDGPLLVQSGPGPLSCAVGTKLFDGGIGPPAAPDATCSPCSCTPNGGCEAELSAFGKSGCDTVVQVATLAPGCNDVSIGGVASFNGQPMRSSLACVAAGGDATVEPPSWTEHVTACLLPAGGGCDGGVCVELDASSDRCIHAAGDVPCPTGAYSERRVVEAVAEDDRGCSECTCSAGNVTCEGSIDVHEVQACGGPTLYQINVPNACLTPMAPIEMASLRYTPAQPGSCSANTTEAQGSVTTETRTLCCIP